MKTRLKWNKNESKLEARAHGFKYIICVPYVQSESHFLYLEWGKDEWGEAAQTISICAYTDINHCKSLAESHHAAICSTLNKGKSK